MTCDKCGHPNVLERFPIPTPDPRRGMIADCSVCKRSVVYSTHHWETNELGEKKYVCCDCMSPTKALNTMVHQAGGSRNSK